MIPRRSRRAARGFTLVEISVVVLIVALVLTTATVRLDNVLPTSRGESAARQLLSQLDLARTAAVAYGGPYAVELDLEGDRFRIVTPRDEDGRLARDPEQRAALGWHELPSGVHFGGVLDSSGQSLERGVYGLQFDPRGSAQDLYIYLENDAGPRYTLTVRILALTGASKVLHERYVPAPVTEADL